MERIKALSSGTQLVLVCATALFLNLSLTWQRIEVDFGPAGKAERLLDGWDLWGLLVGLLALGLVVLTVLAHLTEVELPRTDRWDRVALGIAIAIFALTLAKGLLDAGSTVVSYVGLGLATLVVTGAYLDARQARSARSSSAARA